MGRPRRVNAVANFGAICAALLAHAAAANDFTITPSGITAWDIAIDGALPTSNPDLTLYTGQSYTFNVSASSTHPFWIKTVRSTGVGNGYMGTGLSANGVMSSTTITFDVPNDAPATLFYNCANHPGMTGTIHVVLDALFKDGFE